MRVLGGLLGASVLLVATLVTATRFLTAGDRYLSILAALSPYAVIGFVLVLLGVGIALLRGSRGRTVLALTVVAVVGVAAHLVWLAPRFVADARPAGDARLRVLTANLQFSRADPVRLVRDLRRQGVDVAVLEEVRPYGLTLLERAGLRRVLPNVVGTPADSARGTMVFSRLPLSAADTLPLGNAGVGVTVRSPLGAFRLLAAHTAQPVDDGPGWVRDLGVLRERAAAAVADGPTVVAGDLNATVDHRLLRGVLGVGLTDAVDGAGSGWQPTWPNAYGYDWTRPIVAIDHVLTSKQLVAVDTRTIELRGSDHRGLLVVLSRR